MGKQNKADRGGAIRCDCGKLIAVMKNGKITVKCRGCGRIVPLLVLTEPRADRAKSR